MNCRVIVLVFILANSLKKLSATVGIGFASPYQFPKRSPYTKNSFCFNQGMYVNCEFGKKKQFVFESIISTWNYKSNSKSTPLLNSVYIDIDKSTFLKMRFYYSTKLKNHINLNFGVSYCPFQFYLDMESYKDNVRLQNLYDGNYFKSGLGLMTGLSHKQWLGKRKKLFLQTKISYEY